LKLRVQLLLIKLKIKLVIKNLAICFVFM